MNNLDSEGTPLLHIAVNNKKADMVKLLLENNANMEICDREYATALFLAVQVNAVRSVQLLLYKGANFEGVANVRTVII